MALPHPQGFAFDGWQELFGDVRVTRAIGHLSMWPVYR